MRHQLIILCLCFFSFAGKCQEDDRMITKVVFTSATRGYQKQVFITSDSLIRIENGRGGDKMFKRKLEPTEWNAIIKSLNDVSIEQISQLQPPSTRSAFDGARQSVIELHTKDGEVSSHTFDDEYPNKKLQPLMTTLKGLNGWQ